MKSIADILREAIAQYDADGLCNDDCGCDRGDLWPCGEPQLDCQLAKKVKPTEEQQSYYNCHKDDDFYVPLK